MGARTRHWENIVDSLENSLKQAAIMAAVCSTIRFQVLLRLAIVWMCVSSLAMSVGIAIVLLLIGKLQLDCSAWMIVTICAFYFGSLTVFCILIRDHVRHFEYFLTVDL